ncbi:MAG: hypothetical protein RBR02_09690 [Desulfuromonadaceae bacterium]|nr:hypothetical protein [Desulfuromonadaceae bacterium]
MKKGFLYRLFGVGAVPKQLLQLLQQEGIIVIDAGMRGRFIAKHVNGPRRRYRHRSEGFSGCLAVTKQRVVCYTYWKRQINICVKDPKIPELYVDVPKEKTLSISFESSSFREGWDGVVEFSFHTEKALLFRDALLSIGAHQGAAPGTAPDHHSAARRNHR